MPLSPGDVLDDKFRIVRLLGEGGMGIVYEGTNIRIGRRVAIKVLHTDVAADEDSTRRFEHEARAAAATGSPYVVDVLDLGDLGDHAERRHYLVMEYLEGETLAARLAARGTLEVPEVVRIAEQALRGLAALHDAGIVHRDIKPANLFLARTPHAEMVKILDFGVAKAAATPSERTPETRTGALIGTPRYMSPEQARGLHRLVDLRADLYALGVVVYEALTGRVPFEGESLQDLMFRIVLEEPTPIESLAPGVDPRLAAILRCAMARAPENRYPSARAFHAELAAWAETVDGLKESFRTTIPPARTSQNAPDTRAGAGVAIEVASPPVGMAPQPLPKTPTAWSERAFSPTQRADSTGDAAVHVNRTRAEGNARSAPPPAITAKPSPRRRTLAIVAAVIAALGVAVGVGLDRRAKHDTAGRDARDGGADAAMKREVVAITDLPIPATSPEAAADFAAALRIFRDGNTPQAMVRLYHAIQIDPKLGAAYVQRAFMAASDDPVSARSDYLRALDSRDTLDARDGAIVKALGPCVLTEPTDFRACILALAPLRATYPHDTEIAFVVASILAMSGDVDASTALFREARALDPQFAYAWARVGQDEAYLGSFGDARRSFASCLEAVPTSTFCRMNRLWVEDQEGDTAACEADARTLTVIAPNDVQYLETFPAAIAAIGTPRAGVEDALRPLLPKWNANGSYKEGLTPIALDILDGRFDLARPALEALQERFIAFRDPWRWLHMTRALFALYDEIGDREAGARLAGNLAKRLSVLPTNQGAEDWAVAEDPIPLFYEARFRAGEITRAQRDAERAAWVASWKARTTSTYFGFVWTHGYAEHAEKNEDGIDAMRALASLGSIPPYRPKTATNAAIGHTLFLAGNAKDAIPYLRKGAQSCSPLDFPFPFVRARLWLGDALAATGDMSGACEAMASVLARWGDAKPSSRTATAARVQMRDLGCP